MLLKHNGCYIADCNKELNPTYPFSEIYLGKLEFYSDTFSIINIFGYMKKKVLDCDLVDAK